MEEILGTQLLKSLSNAKRQAPQVNQLASTLNVFIVMLGFCSIAVGYMLSSVPPERLGQSVSSISKTVIDLAK